MDRRLEPQTRGLLLVATLVARLAKKLAVLLLRHTLATLLDNGTHVDLTKNRGHAAGRPATRAASLPDVTQSPRRPPHGTSRPAEAGRPRTPEPGTIGRSGWRAVRPNGRAGTRSYGRRASCRPPRRPSGSARPSDRVP